MEQIKIVPSDYNAETYNVPDGHPVTIANLAKTMGMQKHEYDYWKGGYKNYDHVEDEGWPFGGKTIAEDHYDTLKGIFRNLYC